ncbi:MAG: TonB-dependent receptor plug domain-containing protein [Chitinophagaceae bacterium]|nr:TonB-dependent receptor plug domain-containing protein [Chitinophagaceae bacterium]
MTKKKINKLLLAFLTTCAVCGSQGLYAQQVKKDSITVTQNVISVTGVVTEAAGKRPLSGVRVEVKGFSAAITDDDGTFQLKVPSYNADVEVSAEGYASKQVSLKGSKAITIALLTATAPNFQDEAVMPFGTARKRNLTSAVTSYDANSEWTRPFETGDAVLQGKVSGLNSIRRSGTAGIGANLFLRGYNSLYGSNAPLVVVDGIVYDINDYGGNIITNNYNSFMCMILITIQ